MPSKSNAALVRSELPLMLKFAPPACRVYVWLCSPLGSVVERVPTTVFTEEFSATVVPVIEMSVGAWFAVMELIAAVRSMSGVVLPAPRPPPFVSITDSPVLVRIDFTCAGVSQVPFRVRFASCRTATAPAA